MRKSPTSLVLSHNDVNTTPLHREKLVTAIERDTDSGEVLGHIEMIISRPAVGEIVLTAVRREAPSEPVEQVKPKKADKKEKEESTAQPPAPPPTAESTESSSAPSTGDASDKDDAKKPEGKKNK